MQLDIIELIIVYLDRDLVMKLNLPSSLESYSNKETAIESRYIPAVIYHLYQDQECTYKNQMYFPDYWADPPEMASDSLTQNFNQLFIILYDGDRSRFIKFVCDIEYTHTDLRVFFTLTLEEVKDLEFAAILSSLYWSVTPGKFPSLTLKILLERYPQEVIPFAKILFDMCEWRLSDKERELLN